MDFLEAQDPLDYPIYLRIEPTLPGTDANAWSDAVRHRPMRDYSFLEERSLATYDHPIKWVKVKPVMAEFEGKGKETIVEPWKL